MIDKINIISSDNDGIFVCINMDHNPNEIIEDDDTIYTSVILFIHSSFARKFDYLLTKQGFMLKKWSRKRGNNVYREKFKNFFLCDDFQNLPIFFMAIQMKGKYIHQCQSEYLQQMNFDLATLNKVNENNKNYDIYNVFKYDVYCNSLIPHQVKILTKKSVSAVHISHYIARITNEFEKFCNYNNLSFIYNFDGDRNIQIYHDYFPSNDKGMAEIIASILQKYGICLCHWGKQVDGQEVMDDLISDNLCGLFSSEKYKLEVQKFYNSNKNKTLLRLERRIL